jgi:hypothetical protein
MVIVALVLAARATGAGGTETVVQGGAESIENWVDDDTGLCFGGNTEVDRFIYRNL